jgi:hypothetical protein
MKSILILVLALSCSAVAQGPGDVFFQAPIQAGAIAFNSAGPGAAVVKGAPYSATITNESVQTLADGNRIVQSSDGSAARDSQGRTRQDAPLPMIGGLSAADAPHLVMIQDPVAGVSYTLNLTDKTAWKHAIAPPDVGMPGTTVATNTVVIRSGATTAAGEFPPPPAPGTPAMFARHVTFDEPGNATTENLGTQTMEGVQVTGVRTTRTIAAGKIGNDRPINIVTEVWTSPELKTIVLSKRNDPRSGEQTFKLTNIQRGDPDPSLFIVPSDFKTNDNGAETIIYRTKH